MQSTSQKKNNNVLQKNTENIKVNKYLQYLAFHPFCIFELSPLEQLTYQDMGLPVNCHNIYLN